MIYHCKPRTFLLVVLHMFDAKFLVVQHGPKRVSSDRNNHTFALPITRVLIVPKALQCTVHTSWKISVPIGKQRDTALHTCCAETRHRDAGPATMKPLTAAAIASSSMDSLAVSHSRRERRKRGREEEETETRCIFCCWLFQFPLQKPLTRGRRDAALPLQHQDSTKAGRQAVRRRAGEKAAPAMGAASNNLSAACTETHMDPS